MPARDRKMYCKASDSGFCRAATGLLGRSFQTRLCHPRACRPALSPHTGLPLHKGRPFIYLQQSNRFTVPLKEKQNTACLNRIA